MRDFALSIVETIRHPLLVLDGDLRVHEANAAFYRTFNASGSKTKKHLFYELVGGQWDIPRLRELLDEVARDGGSFKDVEVLHDFPQVGLKAMVLEAHRVVHDDGTPMILLAIEDATEKKQALDALYKFNRELDNQVSERTVQLEAANRELEAFAFSVSHDLRALDGFSDELLRSYADRLDNRGQHYIRRLRSGTQRMGQLIDDMLQFFFFERGRGHAEQLQLRC
jgi:signal transduction histidine kinase